MGSPKGFSKEEIDKSLGELSETCRRMDEAIALERGALAQLQSALIVQRETLESAIRDARAEARRVAFDEFLNDFRVEQRQYVRKSSGFRSPAARNAVAFDAAVEEIAAATARLLESLEVHQHQHPAQHQHQHASQA